MSATAGLNVIMHCGAVVTLLTGVELSWKQDAKRFTPCGSLQPAAVLRGAIAWDGSFKKAYQNNKYLGTFNLGTWNWIGTVYPVGGTNPYIAGTILLTGGKLGNMAKENVEATDEDNTFIIYNLTFTD